jgi:hypothetical protein
VCHVRPWIKIYIRALVANLLGLSDEAMMTLDVPNGGAFAFERVFAADGSFRFVQLKWPENILAKAATPITEPPAVQPPPDVPTTRRPK